MKFIEKAKEVGLALRVLEVVPVRPAQQESTQAVCVASVISKQPEIKEVAKESLVKPFCVREIEHDVILDGITYRCWASNLEFMSGYATWADVVISRPHFWQVKSRLMLTAGGRPKGDYENAVIFDFANAGFMVNRKLITACIFPLQMQVLEIERRLVSFE